MINGITPPGSPPIAPLRAAGITRGAPAAAVRTVAGDPGAAPTPASDLAAAGPPVDAGRVAAIKAAIADGSYRIDADAIAGKMIDLDLPPAR